MSTKIENRFNLVEEAWVPVTGEGLMSLKRIFSDPSLRSLGGNPIQKIAITKLLLAIAQAAYTPEDDDAWLAIGSAGLAKKALQYLEEKKDLFWLYGEKPFLQIPAISKAALQHYGAVLPDVAVGNTTVLLESQIERQLADADKALLLVALMSFALGGKKTDNSVVLTFGYSGKSNEKGKPSTGKPGPSVGFLGFLHSFILGPSLHETVWLNLFTKCHISEIKHLNAGQGTPPWEMMPQGEDCPTAKTLKNSFIGRLVPLSRFVLFQEKEFHYSEGIAYPSYKEGGIDFSAAVDFSNKPKALWVNPERRPWRQLTALLSFLSSEGDSGFDCKQLSIGLLRARGVISEFGIWSGGLKVSSNAGEQYASGIDDFVESEIYFLSSWLGETWFAQLKAEMSFLEDISAILYGSSMGYFRQLKSDGKEQANKASNLFWQLCERKFQALVDACGADATKQTDIETKELRKIFAGFVHKAYNFYCPKDTARQLDAWAANRPNLGKYFAKS